MKKTLALIGLLFVFSLSFTLSAQTPIDTSRATTPLPPKEAPKEKGDLRANLNESGTHFVRFTMLMQVWARYNESNPGTAVNGHLESSTTDIGIRRARFQLMGQVTDRIFFYAQFGMNNFSYLSQRKVGFFIHDITGEYAFVPKKFTVGMGLSGWSGPLRYSSPSVASFVGYDAPLFQQATNDLSDQFLRKLGVYFKGKLGKLDYRVNIAKPMIINYAGNTGITGTAAPVPNLTQVPVGTSTFSVFAPSMQYNGYFMYQFKDQEDNMIPYTQGTYLGKKKVFNIGVGGVYQQNAMWHLDKNTPTDTVNSALYMIGADVYYDAAINAEKGTSVSLYGGYMYSNYGPNYVRNLGVMNPADPNTKGYAQTTTSVYNSGGGNSFGINGTGNTFYAQAGYKFKNDLLKSYGTLMPYVMSQVSSFQKYSGMMYTFDVGINWLLKGHNSKFTLDYQNRPFFSQAVNTDPIKQSTRRSCVILQYQVFF
jgi:hypothetical protein